MSLSKHTNPPQKKGCLNKTTQLFLSMLPKNQQSKMLNNLNAIVGINSGVVNRGSAGSKMLKTMQDCRNFKPGRYQQNGVMTQDDIDQLFDMFCWSRDARPRQASVGRENRENREPKEASAGKEPKEASLGKDFRELSLGRGSLQAMCNGMLSYKKQVMTDCCEILRRRNCVHGVKFLRMDEYEDKFMTGIDQEYLEQQKIDTLFSHFDNNKDLTAEFKRNYVVGQIIGQGAYASVRVAISKSTNKKIAIKIYEKQKLQDPQRKKSIRRQITILSLLSHKNIVKLMDVVESNNHLNLIMEYLPGTSLSSYLKSQPRHKIPQKQCKIIFLNLAKALQYMHSMNIAHRDIKLENVILCTQGEGELEPKIIDFGFSTCIQKDRKIRIFCGTPSYMAPQVVQKREYRGEGADVWALGVMLFVCVTGVFPFKGATDQELYKKINNSDYPKAQLIFSKKISDLISKMLKIDPQQRITASQVFPVNIQILEHTWFDSDEQVHPPKKYTELSSDKYKHRYAESSHEKPKKRINTQVSTEFKEKEKERNIQKDKERDRDRDRDNKWGHKTGVVNNFLREGSANDKVEGKFKLQFTMTSPKNRPSVQSYRLGSGKQNVKTMRAEKEREKQRERERQRERLKLKDKQKKESEKKDKDMEIEKQIEKHKKNSEKMIKDSVKLFSFIKRKDFQRQKYKKK